jgi:hypothetical protein
MSRTRVLRRPPATFAEYNLPIPHFRFTNFVTILPLAVNVAVGKPEYEDVPYGGHKAKNGMNVNTWDESDDDASRTPEGDVAPKVSATALSKSSITSQSPPGREHWTQPWDSI